jgi:hypothetical protein
MQRHRATARRFRTCIHFVVDRRISRHLGDSHPRIGPRCCSIHPMEK